MNRQTILIIDNNKQSAAHFFSFLKKTYGIYEINNLKYSLAMLNFCWEDIAVILLNLHTLQDGYGMDLKQLIQEYPHIPMLTYCSPYSYPKTRISKAMGYDDVLKTRNPKRIVHNKISQLVDTNKLLHRFLSHIDESGQTNLKSKKMGIFNELLRQRLRKGNCFSGDEIKAFFQPFQCQKSLFLNLFNEQLNRKLMKPSIHVNIGIYEPFSRLVTTKTMIERHPIRLDHVYPNTYEAFVLDIGPLTQSLRVSINRFCKAHQGRPIILILNQKISRCHRQALEHLNQVHLIELYHHIHRDKNYMIASIIQQEIIRTFLQHPIKETLQTKQRGIKLLISLFYELYHQRTNHDRILTLDELHCFFPELEKLEDLHTKELPKHLTDQELIAILSNYNKKR